MDAIAVEVAKENARRNKVARKIRVRKATVEPGQPVPGAPFDVVAANISAFVLKNAAEGLATASKPGAPAILSGILEMGAADVRATYEAAGWEHVETRGEGDWIAMVVRRRRLPPHPSRPALPTMTAGPAPLLRRSRASSAASASRWPAPQAHQISRVLRLKPGDRVVLVDGAGQEYRRAAGRGAVVGGHRRRSRRCSRAGPSRA